jgi:uncharacterized protein (TIGR02594 family)
MQDWMQLAPYFVIGIIVLANLAIFWGMKGLLKTFSDANATALKVLDGALARQQAVPVAPAVVPAAPDSPRTSVAPPDVKPLPAPVPPPAKPVPLPPQPPPIPSGAFPGAPPWFLWALHEIGFHETGNNQGIGKYIALAHTGSEGDPWCAIFANAALEANSVPGTRSPSSQSFKTNANFVRLQTPSLGCLAVFWRGSPDSGLGHVGFYRGEDATDVWVLGGNESDMVQIEPLPKAGKTFGLIGYWWPKGVALPTTGPIILAADTPSTKTDPTVTGGKVPATADGWIIAVTATTEGGPADPEISGYTGRLIDDNQIGCSLPFHYPAPLPEITVRNVAGRTMVLPLVDVGPWNTHDDYVTSGKRPLVEQQFASKTKAGNGRVPTNDSAIDLTLAAAIALGIDGKGKLDIRIIQPTAPAVT